MENKPKKCAFIALIGLPNSGKSTLLNHILGSKVSIVTHKPQTTRFRIMGISILQQTQLVFMDTPGIF
ncbi:MAG: GTP-binding protein, partial [Alphaproteobacteria bacterium]|nr:GTP-binding protein [Alphaproteobacteria bacterium]